MTSRNFKTPVLSLAVAWALAACGGGSDAPALQVEAPVTAAVAGSVPATAMASPEALVSFQQGLAVDDRIEPLSLQQMLPPLSDTTEPMAIGG